MELTADALLSANGLEAAKLVVTQAIATSNDVRMRYGWAQPIFAKNTETAIADALAAEPARRIYKINPLSENLSAAGQLIDLAIARQEAVYGLEIAALNAVTEDVVFNETVDAQERIAQTALAASIGQAGAGSAANADDVSKIFSTQRSMQQLRASGRSVAGSALNLAERVEFLREQQAETVRSIYERLMSVELVLPSSGLGRPKPLPTWNGLAGLNNLRNLAKWTKDAIKSVELALSSEQQIMVCFSTASPALKLYDANDAPLSQTDLIGKIRNPGFDDIKFDFDQTLIKALISYENSKSYRILAAGAAVVFDEDFDKVKSLISSSSPVTDENAKREIIRQWRNSLRFGLKVVAPAQVGTLADGNPSRSWSPARIELDNLVTAANVTDLSQMTNLPTDRVANLNPLGRWIVSVNDLARSPSAISNRLSDRPFGANTKMSDAIGIVFVFRLAVQR
jgi:hypothetical protein